ncbi:NUDIX hydrolase [Microlunatus antarcticus]|uniref:8-oxo-dGTP pyrophosphatase MutT (NUDIX family) n=1 Tax=Microlunatus antarcticus TaxID=53388 RepID=A0A7W5P5J6_9ACTN|nr:8-oxo-dGTP pyrophosphatase MutT (NUDIX family) [Microlunatus antarcticus]
MTESVQPPVRTRSYSPVENPANRPRVTRRTVRVLLLNPDGATLLFEDSDPGLVDVRWWVTPGGGIDPGESETEAAVREVREETGFDLDPGVLLGPVARRHVVHGYSDQVIEQDEAFYLAQVDTFDVDVTGHTAEEQITFKGWRWWSEEDLRASDEWVWPRELEEILLLLDHADRWPVDLGFQEESTVLDVS